MAAGAPRPASAPAPDLIDPWLWRHVPLLGKLAMGLITIGAMVAAGMYAAENYPRLRSPTGTELEQRLAQVFSDPAVAEHDDKVVGDYLIERFYIIDVITGERYVGDFLKGRIESIQVNDGPSYMYLLDLRGPQRESQLVKAYVDKVSNAGSATSGYYLGLTVPAGLKDAFPVNYDGGIPAERAELSTPEFESLHAFILGQKYEDVTRSSPRLLSIHGYNYLVNNSEHFPVFKTEYSISKAIFVSELVIVDATARPNRAAMLRLHEQYPGILGR